MGINPGVGGYILWIATHAKDKATANTFATGSKQSNVYNISKPTYYALIDLALFPLTMHGCVHEQPPAQEAQQDKEEIKNDVDTTNQVVD